MKVCICRDVNDTHLKNTINNEFSKEPTTIGLVSLFQKYVYGQNAQENRLNTLEDIKQQDRGQPGQCIPSCAPRTEDHFNTILENIVEDFLEHK